MFKAHECFINPSYLLQVEKKQWIQIIRQSIQNHHSKQHYERNRTGVCKKLQHKKVVMFGETENNIIRYTMIQLKKKVSGEFIVVVIDDRSAGLKAKTKH